MNQYGRLAQDIDVFLSNLGVADYMTYMSTADWPAQFPGFIEGRDILLASIHRTLKGAAAEYPEYSTAAYSLAQRLEEHMPSLVNKAAADHNNPPTPVKKFENVDVLMTLEAILNKNPSTHRVFDFMSVKEAVTNWSQSSDLEDKHFIWLSYSHGNISLLERNTFMAGTPTHSTLFEMGSQPGDNVLAYLVDIDSYADGKVMGNVYAVDYLAYTRHVKECAIPVASVTLLPEEGSSKPEVDVSFYDYKNLNHPAHGYGGIRYNPKSEKSLNAALRAERRVRQTESVPYTLKKHLRDLSDAMSDAEAKRITILLAGIEKPNTPNKTHFMVELDPAFAMVAGNRETSALLQKVPYKGLQIGTLKGEKGLFAMVPHEKVLKRGRKLVQAANIDDGHTPHYGEDAAPGSLLAQLKQPAAEKHNKPQGRKKPDPER